MMSEPVAAGTIYDEADLVPVGDIIMAVRGELAELECLVVDLQGILRPSQGAVMMTAPFIGNLQTLDFITQRLHAIGVFLDDISPTLFPPAFGCPSRATKRVTLSDMAARLAACTSSHPNHSTAPSGELELFTR